MAIATSTALVIASVGVSAASAGMSFAQANKQKKLQREAERDAQAAMADARKRLQVNYYDELAIQKEPYELEREALLSAGAQAIQAGVEGESRGVAPTAGRVLMAQNEAQAGQRTAMGQEMLGLEKLSVTEDSRLRDVNVQLDLEEVAGAQLAARDAQEANAAYMAQGMQGLQSMAQTGIQMAPLYNRNIGAQKAAVSKVQMTPAEQDAFRGAGTQDPNLVGPPAPVDFSGTGSMSNAEYRKFLRGLTEQQRQLLFQNQTYNPTPNPFSPF